MNQPLTAKQAAKRLGVTDARIRQMCADGRLAGAWKMGRDWLIPERSIAGEEKKRKDRH